MTLQIITLVNLPGTAPYDFRLNITHLSRSRVCFILTIIIIILIYVVILVSSLCVFVWVVGSLMSSTCQGKNSPEAKSGTIP